MSLQDKLVAELRANGITSDTALANVLAQVAAESNFKPQSENLNFSAERLREIFPNRFPTLEDARRVTSKGPEAVGNAIYGDRMGNNGEGFKYRGRGLIQLTGKQNYAAASKALGIDFVNNPDLANDPDNAVRLASWYVTQFRGLSDADAQDMNRLNRAIGFQPTPETITKRLRLADKFRAELAAGAFSTPVTPSPSRPEFPEFGKSLDDIAKEQGVAQQAPVPFLLRLLPQIFELATRLLRALFSRQTPPR